MTDKPALRDRKPLDEAFEDFKPTMRKIAERSHPLPATLTKALRAPARRGKA